MAKIRQLLADTRGTVSVSGHTDNSPIKTERFRSNWDLSSARAVSVAHELMLGGVVAAERVSVSGHADTKPLDESDSDAARGRNRRVEIIVEH
jgi:chemotaxis protein MotB